MGKRIICGCVVLGIVACLIGCQKSDNYELMKESKQQVLWYESGPCGGWSNH